MAHYLNIYCKNNGQHSQSDSLFKFGEQNKKYAYLQRTSNKTRAAEQMS